ncbi:MAG: NUDIX hydrolase [Gammaproteobacteria bacterium]|nr:NUDIX hydrolase [Gammaproteobacteria bacterium]
MAAAPPQARFSICLIEDAASRLLFLKRAPDRALGPALWGFPAGHIEANETPQACALREMREEIGAEHELTLRNTLGPIRDSFYGGIYEIHLFHWRWLGGVITLNAEHTSFAWLTVEDIAPLEFMDGIEEDIALLDIWPRAKLNQHKLPPHLRAP